MENPELESIVKNFVIEKYQKRFGGVTNGRTINYIEMETKEYIDEDKKKSKLRDFNIEILEGGNEEELQEKIENIDEIVKEEMERESMWGDNIFGRKLDNGHNYPEITSILKMKNLKSMKMEISMDKSSNFMKDDEKSNYILQFLDGQIHQEYKRMISAIPITIIDKKIGIFIEHNKFTMNNRNHPKSYYGNLSFLERNGIYNLDKFEYLEFLDYNEVLLIPPQKEIIFSYLNFTSGNKEMSGNTRHVLHCTIDMVAEPHECVLLKINDDLT